MLVKEFFTYSNFFRKFAQNMALTPTRVAGYFAIVALLAVSACRRPAARPLISADEIVRRYLTLTAQMGDQDPDSLDFLVVDKENGAANTHSPGLAALQAKSLTLRADLARIPVSSTLPNDRKQYLLAQVDALIFRIQQLEGKTHTFDEESRALFGVVAPQDTSAEARKDLRSQLAQLLPKSESPAAAYATYSADFIVPRERVPAVMEEALGRCRAFTRANLALPDNESVRVQYVSQKPWSAFSRYLGDSKSLIQVNMDHPLTVGRILELACHEGYPGHHVFNLLRDQAMVKEQHREEFRAQLTFSPLSYVSEAAATYAPTLAMSDEERTATERDLLTRAGVKPQDLRRYVEVERLVGQLHTAEPAIARDYLDGRVEFVRAAEALERETLMSHAETMLLYLNEFRSYMLTYTMGADQMKAYIESGNPPKAERWQRYLRLARAGEDITTIRGETVAAQGGSEARSR